MTGLDGPPCWKVRANRKGQRSTGFEDMDCEKDFPKDLSNHTVFGETLSPVYRRRGPAEGGHTLKMKSKYVKDNNGHTKELTLDNRWIVPHNRYLLAKYKSHINLEIIGSVGAIKYLFKYITKGQDKITVEKRTQDEITEHVNASWYGDTNSFWRIFGFDLNEMSPSVQKLAIHMPNEQYVVYDPDRVTTNADLREMMSSQSKTTLTAFFELNQRDPEARHIKYPDILTKYRWATSGKDDEGNSIAKTFQRRKRRSGRGVALDECTSNQIGRIPVIVPHGTHQRQELYFLRLLLHHVSGRD